MKTCKIFLKKLRMLSLSLSLTPKKLWACLCCMSIFFFLATEAFADEAIDTQKRVVNESQKAIQQNVQAINRSLNSLQSIVQQAGNRQGGRDGGRALTALQRLGSSVGRTQTIYQQQTEQALESLNQQLNTWADLRQNVLEQKQHYITQRNFYYKKGEEYNKFCPPTDYDERTKFLPADGFPAPKKK